MLSRQSRSWRTCWRQSCRRQCWDLRGGVGVAASVRAALMKLTLARSLSRSTTTKRYPCFCLFLCLYLFIYLFLRERERDIINYIWWKTSMTDPKNQEKHHLKEECSLGNLNVSGACVISSQYFKFWWNTLYTVWVVYFWKTAVLHQQSFPLFFFSSFFWGGGGGGGCGWRRGYLIATVKKHL